jgi:hypothetical protein
MLGLDYTSRIDPAALKQAGVAVVFRYTTWLGWPKSLTKAEADELLAAGIPIVANFESTADRMRGAATAGHADAVEVLQHLADLGAPSGLKVWFSADWDVQDTEVVLGLDYLHAAADVLGGKDKVGCYGGLRAVSAAADAGFAIWQTSAWSYGRWDPRCAARQDGGQALVGGVQADLNTILNYDALGAWNGADPMSYTVSAGWQADYPDVAGALAAHMPPGTVLDVDHAAGYSAVRSFVAAERAATIEDKLDQLLARPAAGPVVDPVVLAAALGPLLHPSLDAAAVAAQLVPHLPGTPDALAFAQALADHIKVVAQ